MKLKPASAARRLLLINPNTSRDSTRMMQAIVQASLPDCKVDGATATHGVPMIATREQLARAADATLACWRDSQRDYEGVVLGCFGDPALEELRRLAGVPVVGLCEAAMLDAAQQGRRFGIATTTPDLAEPLAAQAARLGLSAQYTGLRATPGDPLVLLQTGSAALEEALLAAVRDCAALDGAEAVILGGGPLGHMAVPLARRSPVALVAPLVAAAQRLRRQLTPLHEGDLAQWPA